MDLQAVKFVDEEKGIIEGLAIPYGGPVKQSEGDLGKDLTGEYFSKDTDFTSERYDGNSVKSMPQLYHHGMDPDVKDKSIGEVVSIEDHPDGKWYKVQLDKANEYYEAIRDLVKRGALLFSSGAFPERVVKAADGFISKWPLKENSLTPTPANPLAAVGSFKALVGAIKAEIVQQYDSAEVAIGMKEEREHNDITHGNPETIEKIVVAHLKEDPHYYTKLKQAMAKAIADNKEVKNMDSEKKPANGEPQPGAPKEGEVKPESKEDVKAMAGGTLPDAVVQALVALHDSIVTILPNVEQLSSQGQNQPQEQPQPNQGGEKPQSPPAQPGVNQGMAPENRPVKAETEPPKEEKKPDKEKDDKSIKSITPEAFKAMLDGVITSVKESVKEAVKPLEERIKKIEESPASPGPKRDIAVTDNFNKAANPHMEIPADNGAMKTMLDNLVKDPDISPGTRAELGRRAAMFSLEEVVKKGPQKPR